MSTSQWSRRGTSLASTHVMIKPPAVLMLISAFGCGDGGPSNSGECPMSSTAQAILSAEAIRHAVDGTWIVAETHGTERAYARNLIGTFESHMGSFILAEACTQAMTYDPYCEPCEQSPCAGSTRCSHYRCDAAGEGALLAWWGGQELSYEAEWEGAGAGSVTYGAEPTVEIFYNAVGTTMTLRWQSEDMVSASAGGETLELDSELEGTGTVESNEPVAMEVTVTYPLLDAELSLRRGEDGLEGSLEVGGETLGDVSETVDSVPGIAWREQCGF